MTENERLRALLTEAKSWVAHGSHLRARIDVVLAEPVEKLCSKCSKPTTKNEFRGEFCAYCEMARLWNDLYRERDEAMAEVERLKSFAEGPTWDTHRESVAAGYQRGVAAMRKAVSDYLDRHGWFLSGQARASILAIPDPKDK